VYWQDEQWNAGNSLFMSDTIFSVNTSSIIEFFLCKQICFLELSFNILMCDNTLSMMSVTNYRIGGLYMKFSRSSSFCHYIHSFYQNDWWGQLPYRIISVALSPMAKTNWNWAFRFTLGTFLEISHLFLVFILSNGQTYLNSSFILLLTFIRYVLSRYWYHWKRTIFSSFIVKRKIFHSNHQHISVAMSKITTIIRTIISYSRFQFESLYLSKIWNSI
jgi:hypothetical protein